MNRVRAIFFDLGNVLVRFDPAILEEALEPFSKTEKGKVTEYLLESENVDKYMEGRLSASSFYAKTCRLFKMKIKFGEFYSIWNSIFFPYPEVEEIVKRIKENYPEVKIILISNTNNEHFEFIKKNYKVLELFDGFAVSHEVGRCKPHPDIFQEALKLSGTLPKDTFYTDDRLDLIEAARVLGLRAFQFTGHEKLISDLAKCGVEI